MKNKSVSPWAWVPSLYFSEALPYVAVMFVSMVMYKRLGISNTDIALYTSGLALPWVIKPFWSPFVDLLKTKRWWIVSMQFFIGAALAAIAFTLPMRFFFQASLAVFWVMAFCSATHDIAADGFYMLGLSTEQQSFFVGIRSTFYRIATLAGQGLLVILAGWLEKHPEKIEFLMGRSVRLFGSAPEGATAAVPMAWALTLLLTAVVFLGFACYHRAVLPWPVSDCPAPGGLRFGFWKEFAETFLSFFQKKQAVAAILFMLLYRFPEAQLVKLVTPFLLDSREAGGLGLTTSQLGWTYGTLGIAGLMLGGIVGGIVVSRGGLKKWLWPMATSITLPNLAYVYLSMAQPENLRIVDACVFVEQFGYGFGFTAYMLFLIYYADGEYKTAHYAIATAFMALGLMLPGMAAGWLQERLGYERFFWWVMGCCSVTLAVTAWLKIDPAFGRKK